MRQVLIPLPVWYSHMRDARRSIAIEDPLERSKRTEIHRYVSKTSRNHARIIK